MEKKDKLYIGLYNDFYGTLLTEKQRGIIGRYYDDDMSLSEIAMEHGISPQGVRDAIVRAEGALEDYEDKLGMVAKTQKLRDIAEALKPLGAESARLADEMIRILGE